MAAISIIKRGNIQNPSSGRREKMSISNSHGLVKYLKIRHENIIYRINKIQYIMNKSNMAAITIIETGNIQNPLSDKREKLIYFKLFME